MLTELQELRRRRLVELLELLAQQGLSQQQVAARANIPAQYLSDIKNGRRQITELVARRLGEEFQVDYEWLMGNSEVMETPSLGSLSAIDESGDLYVPVFPHPISGNPRTNPNWDGSVLELAGVAASKAAQATDPYILRFGRDDHQRRLCRADLILISQIPAGSAEISVIKHRQNLYLARPADLGAWQRVADGELLSAKSQVMGHCIGIVWASLCQ